jgi:antitoxin CptB
METPEIRLKRLKLRSMRRGIREMDILLSRFADTAMLGLNAGELDRYEALLEEADQDVLGWVTGQNPTPDQYSALISQIRASA